MRTLVLFILLTCCGSPSWAQGYHWLRPVPYLGQSSEMGLGLQVATSGDEIVLCGITGQGISWGSDTFGDLLFMRVSAFGDLIDSLSYSGQGMVHDLIVTDELIYLHGKFKGSLALGDFTLTSPGDDIHPFIAKLSLEGEVIAAWDLYTELDIDQLSHIAVMPSGDLKLGQSNFSHDNPIYTIDSELVLLEQWEQDINFISDLESAQDGGLFLSGGCVTEAYAFNDSLVPNPYEYSTVIARYDAEGSLIYARLLEDVTCSLSHLVPALDNELYVIWTPVIAQSFDGVDIAGPDWVFSFIVMKLDASGELIWLREFAADDSLPGILGDASLASARPALLRADGGLQLFGSYRLAVDWGDGFSSDNPSSNSDLFVLGIDPEGTVDQLIDSEHGSNYIDPIAMSKSNDWECYQLFRAQTDFQLGSFDTSLDSMQTYLAKWATIPEGLSESERLQIQVYPDPVSEQLNISGIEGLATVYLYGLSGHLISQHALSASERQIDLSGYAPGTYLIQVIDSDNRFAQRSIRVMR